MKKQLRKYIKIVSRIARIELNNISVEVSFKFSKDGLRLIVTVFDEYHNNTSFWFQKSCEDLKVNKLIDTLKQDNFNLIESLENKL